MTWENIPEDITPYVGMFYEVQELDTGMIYLGIKRYWKKVRMKPLKGKKRKRIKMMESDWKTYNTSSKIMQEKLIKNPGNYRKIIKKNCLSITELKCEEAYEQLHCYLSGNWHMLYNQVIHLRVRIRK